ncbi:6929_t:CDS:2, partial [Racocetra persica]
QLDFPNNTAKNISIEKHHEDTQDYSKNKIHPKNNTANDLNESNSNNEFAVLNE